MMIASIRKTIGVYDGDLIERIAQRAFNHGITEDVSSTMLNIAAWHYNGSPLRLKALLEADLFDFVHDIMGIRDHIDSETGLPSDVFHPRFATDRVLS